ncbi:MAG: L-rhamnose isomerase [Candidatus Lernaella stagnicola]|nr:L-rhamnose isomerase [Candidatus Lernaella stagnicola]
MDHEAAFAYAAEKYEGLGVDVEAVLAALAATSLSLHCWQADDVTGFETAEGELGGGLAVTGNYPGKARNVTELRDDMLAALAVIPGRHRVNLHAMYGDFGGRKVDRNQIEPDHFAGWVDWARRHDLGLDFNATCFSHPLSESGYTLASQDEGVRGFWIEHVRRCRAIGAWMGERLETPCVHNLWIPDGSKDTTVSRHRHRELLRESLNAIFAVEHSAAYLKDSIESKLFGLGSEAFVAGSHDFYMSWAAGRGVMVCLDLGHFHPTESVADKISSLLLFHDELLLHVSRGVRWDSDHVVTLSDEVTEVMREIVRAGALPRVHIALDFFDASINRVAAYAIGARATLKALLVALLEPTELLREFEVAGDPTSRLALLEEVKSFPFGAVWEELCRRHDVPGGPGWLESVRGYEQEVLAKR